MRVEGTQLLPNLLGIPAILDVSKLHRAEENLLRTEMMHGSFAGNFAGVAIIHQHGYLSSPVLLLNTVSQAHELPKILCFATLV